MTAIKSDGSGKALYHSRYTPAIPTGKSRNNTAELSGQDSGFHYYQQDKFISKGKKFVPNGRKVGLNYLSGFTGAMQFECLLALDKDGGGLDEYLPGTDVSLYDHIPLNTPEEKTFDKSMMWNVGGSIGANQQGVSGMITGGVSYTSRETWKEKSYEIIDHAYDDNRDAETKWKLNFKGVTDGSGHAYHEREILIHFKV